MQFGLMLRAQFPQGDDMQVRFQEQLEQARLANALGFASLTKGMHYSADPWQDFQQFPFLSRMMAEAPHMRLDSSSAGSMARKASTMNKNRKGVEYCIMCQTTPPYE